MVNYCVCGGCTNTSQSGHRVHHFPSRKTKRFRAWIRFVQVKRADFTASSVTANSVICGAHFTTECYESGDLMELNMGFRCKDRVRLTKDAVPTVHTDSTRRKQKAGASGQASDGASAGGFATGRQALHWKRELSRVKLGVYSPRAEVRA
ncbi:hypothetical protein ACEWY4_000627 [Coilia grayii]|uniref:THAP domain-containing protein 1 n=1 Tax=Coilia grayii TaxID=363190 RepID=A0ABD1KX79_9TELE